MYPPSYPARLDHNGQLALTWPGLALALSNASLADQDVSCTKHYPLPSAMALIRCLRHRCVVPLMNSKPLYVILCLRTAFSPYYYIVKK